MTRIQLSLDQSRRPVRQIADTCAQPMLAAGGAEVVLGAFIDADGLPASIAPQPDTMFGPRGICLGGPAGPLIVTDTGHHRLLCWRRIPTCDHTPADFVIGQPNMFSEGRNGRGPVGAASLNMPTGIACDGQTLAVADAWNHRILIWRSLPERANQPADIVLGQSDFAGGLANRGSREAGADTLNWCYGVTLAEGRLLAADTGNRRVLIWNSLPRRNGQAADIVLGQTDMTTRDDNASGTGGAIGMRWPHAICVHEGRIFVADAGNNRIMCWSAMPNSDGAPCNFVLGQAGFDGLDHNRAGYYPDPRALNMPYGLTTLAGKLICADTANSRLVDYHLDRLEMDSSAAALAGQHDFTAKGDNRWQIATRDSLCWPFGLSASGTTVAVADTGNNRVLLWDLAP